MAPVNRRRVHLETAANGQPLFDAVRELKAIQHFFVASSGPSRNGMPRNTRFPLGMLTSPLSRVSRLSPFARSRGPKSAGVAVKWRVRSIGTNLSDTV